jgi:hypothetical protein
VTDAKETEWRAEFERLGELLVYENAKDRAIYNDEAKRQAVFSWLSEQARSRRSGEKWTLRVTWWTLFAAIAGVFVGLFGLYATVKKRLIVSKMSALSCRVGYAARRRSGLQACRR